MGIMSAKYKAHKLINIAFYIIVFVFGFLVGIGAKKINFSNILSKFLMIDNAEAFTIYSKNNVTVDEEFIYNVLIEHYPEFSFDITPYILCNVQGTVECTIFSDLSSYYLKTTYSSFYVIGNSAYTGYRFSFEYTPSNNSIRWINDVVGYSPKSIGASTYSFDITFSSNNVKNYSNFDIDLISGVPSTYNSRINVLDFSQYSIPEMVFDEDLFANDPNFKEVCVNNYDTFSITANSIQDYDNNDNPVYHNNDFIWFKNGVKGISTYLYDSEAENHVVIWDNEDRTYTDDPYGWWFWLNSVDEINTYWNSPNSPGIELITRGYTDKYKYYNYTLYPFMMTFTTTYHKYQVFWFRDPYVEYLDGTIEHPEQYCFYIKNNFDVNILNKNEWGDVYSDIEVLGGTTFHDQTTENVSNLNSKGLFSTLRNFISQIRSTIIFINNNIYNFYMSMPLIVRMFITCVLTIFFIKYLIDMLVR